MKQAIVAGLGALALSTALASAQEGTPDADCRERIDRVANRIPDLSENPNAAADMGLREEQLEAALAALDAARIVAYDSDNCDTMVDAAESMLEPAAETASVGGEGPARDAMGDPPVNPTPTPEQEDGRQAAANELSSEEGSSFGWDGRGASRKFDRGELHPDRPGMAAEEETGRQRDGTGDRDIAAREDRWSPLPPPEDEYLEDWAERARAAREAERQEGQAAEAGENGRQRIPDELRRGEEETAAEDRGRAEDREGRRAEARQDGRHRAEGREDGRRAEDREQREARAERREAHRRAVQRALQIAEGVLPTAEFEAYGYGTDEGRRIFEFAGVDRETGRRVEVDVLASGRVEEVEETIPLGVVPDDVRRAVREVVGRFQVDRTERSLRRGGEIYYEFDGSIAATGRPLSIEIRSDGERLAIEERTRG